MAIQIPEIKANMRPDDPSVGRIEEHPIDVVSPGQQQQQALQGLGREVIKYRNEIKNQQADTTATEQSNKLVRQYYVRMNGNPETGEVGLSSMKGDPTQLYKDFDEKMEKTVNDLTTAPDGQNWDPETQNLVNRRVNRQMQELQLNYLTTYGNQKRKYDDSITDSTVDIAKQSLPDATSTIKADDPSTLGGINSNIEKIQNARIAQALRYGTARYVGNEVQAGDAVPYENPDGTPGRVQIGDSVKLQIKKDIADGMYGAVRNLIDSNALDKAKYMQSTYGDMIDPQRRQKLADDMSDTNDDNMAYKLAFQIKGKSGAEQEDILEKADPKTQFKARQYANDLSNYDENQKKRMQETNYQALYNSAQEFQQANPGATPLQFESTKNYKSMVQNLNPAQQKSITNMFAPPKVGDPKAIAKAISVLQGGDVDYPDPTKLNSSQLALLTGSLGTSGQGAQLATKLLNASIPSNAQEVKQQQRALTEIKNVAFAMKYITPDNEFKNDLKKGSPQQQKLTGLQLEFLQDIGTAGQMTPGQLKQHANEFLTQKLGQQPNQPGFWGQLKAKFQGAPQPSPSGSPAPTAPTPAMTAKDARGLAIQAFQKTSPNHRMPSGPELDQYMKTTKGPWSQ